MKNLLIITSLVALAACATPNSDNTQSRSSDVRQEPSNLTPGLHIGGHAQAGVKATF